MMRLTFAAFLLLTQKTSAFVCDGERVIADSKVADDYCDCADGSDEAGKTGACPNTEFRCESKPHKAMYIFASRVDDGICDCCDGTDERTSGVKCQNFCVELAKAELRTSSKASLLRVAREVKGKEEAASRKEKLADARRFLEAGAAELEAAQTAKADAERVEAERREDRERRLAAGEVEAALKMEQLSAEQLRVALARLALNEQAVERCDALHDKLASHPLLKEAMDDVDSADLIEVAMEMREAEEEEGGGGGGEGAGAGDEGTASSAGGCAEAAGACGFEPQLLKLLPLDALANGGEQGLSALVKAFAHETGQMPFLIRVCASLLKGAGVALDDAAVAAALQLLEPFHDQAAHTARAHLQSLEAKRKTSADTVKEFEPIVAMEGEFGESQEWFALYGNCYTARKDTFEYRFCPFDAFQQDGRSLGSFKGWSQPGAVGGGDGGGGGGGAGAVMVFDGGEECDGTPRRASVRFECGEEDELMETTEPSTCVYEASFVTPSACSTQQVREMHAALSAAAQEAGLPYEPDDAVKTLLAL